MALLAQQIEKGSFFRNMTPAGPRREAKKAKARKIRRKVKASLHDERWDEMPAENRYDGWVL